LGRGEPAAVDPGTIEKPMIKLLNVRRDCRCSSVCGSSAIGNLKASEPGIREMASSDWQEAVRRANPAGTFHPQDRLQLLSHRTSWLIEHCRPGDVYSLFQEFLLGGVADL